MQIKEKSVQSIHVCFKDVKEGVTFYYEGRHYMRTDQLAGRGTVVCIDTGRLTDFSDHCKVVITEGVFDVKVPKL